jgi:hypothetical protein
VHDKQAVRLPGEKVDSLQSETSAPPRHSIPGAHWTHDVSLSFWVPGLHRLHPLFCRIYPSSHVQLAALVQKRSQLEKGPHSMHSAAPLLEYMLRGHVSLCILPMQ